MPPNRRTSRAGLRSPDPAEVAGAAHADDAERPSKSQRKRESHALQALGEQLVELRDDVLLRLPLDEDLVEAIRFARTIRSHEGRRRQLQLVGKLMRHADGEAILQEALESLRARRIIR
mgnify:CR=1 FL=1